jgi:hypothetical protein
MGFLKEVQNEQARAKVGLFGSQGSGKTTTAALLAIAVSKTYHNGAPIAMMDTENGSDYLKPIFDAEGVKLLVHKSGAFADMIPVLQEAQKGGCCGFLMDSITHTWRELVESYCNKKARAYNRATYVMQFQDWKEVKAEWFKWTQAFLNSQVHCFIAGRAGYEYEYQENEDTGKKELIKGNTKMKAEGEFGYEPSLLIEMEAERRETNERHRGGSFVHVAYVLKDRARSLNGLKFEFPDINNYKAGDYKKVFKPFVPHFAFLNIAGTQVAIGPNTSEDLFDENGDTHAHQRKIARSSALEEIENIMVLLWPGQDAKSKKIKILVLKELFGLTSWTAIQNEKLHVIEAGLFTLLAFQQGTKNTPLDEEETVIAALREARNHPTADAPTNGTKPEAAPTFADFAS